MEKQFDIARDVAIVNFGGFFCKACLVGKPKEEQSTDPRYCNACFDFLVEEAKFLQPGKHPQWVPARPLSMGVEHNSQGCNNSSEPCKVSFMGTRIIAPLRHRGAKHRVLPDDLITQLSREGKGCKAISTILYEQGIKVSPNTIRTRISL